MRGGAICNGNGVLQLPSTGQNSCIGCEWSLSVQQDARYV